MKKFKIELIDEYGSVQKKFICGHLDITKKLTVLSECEIQIGVNQNTVSNKILVGDIDHWNIFENMITLYYQNGETVEITKIID